VKCASSASAQALENGRLRFEMLEGAQYEPDELLGDLWLPRSKRHMVMKYASSASAQALEYGCLRFEMLEGARCQPDELANDVKCSNGRIKVFVVIMDQFME
jgi:hypothetical protein